MRSNEVAKTAGVTVRTLRHYHQLGLLPEPPRSANGYREYTAADLARVLRIKRLASLGFPLARIGALLEEMDEQAITDAADGEAAGPSPLSALDELDSELALQIEALQEQRRTIAALKAEQLSPDMPVRFGRAIRGIVGNSTDATSHAALVVASHLYGDREMAELERVAAHMQDTSFAAAMESLDQRCSQLAPDAPEAERAAIVSESLDLLAPLIEQFDAANWTREATKEERLLEELANESLNEAQRDVNERIERAIGDILEARAASELPRT
ncbi:MerR family transcriptional regulator [uncultured Adlercreutzia sp.]|uniref:MerR family transcriptional regulator n=1 Tax=uncultured Adlercreutzia sp. TaxID=875803 RepID=UPI0025D3749F|nr:MerR family transcriptional regulator [uncultured Adlercreutzia sp.]MCI9261847.1 MerR family transcriptional regulator [Eggerthellaceae bacterium]